MTTAATIGAIAAGVGVAGSVAGGVLSATGGHGGGGGSGMLPVSLNPGNKFINSIFGAPGSHTAQVQIARSPFANLNQDISNYIQPTSFGPGGPNILSSIIGDPNQYINNYHTALGQLDQAVNTASLFNANGNPTDATPIFNEAIRRYLKDALPAAAETAGLGVSSSGFQSAASNAAQNLLGQASLTNVDLAEAAKNRQLQAAPLLQGLVAARQQLPLNLASDLTGLFNFEARKPIDTFSSIYSLKGPQYAAPAYSPVNTGASSTAGLLGGLGSLLGGLGGGGGSGAAGGLGGLLGLL